MGIRIRIRIGVRVSASEGDLEGGRVMEPSRSRDQDHQRGWWCSKG